MGLQEAEINDQKLAQVRDVFCFTCWTGQRYSDIEKLTREDLMETSDGKLEWHLYTTKTQSRIKVPITPYAEDILNKYKGNKHPLPKYSNQKMNEYLKELGAYLDWDWPEKKVGYFNGKLKQDTVPFTRF